MQKALDISKHQNTFTPAAALVAGVSTVILRAAYGNFMDVRFQQFAADCKAAGLLTGAYIFLTHHYANKNDGDVNAARTIMHKHLDVLMEILEGRGITSWVALDQELEKGQTMTLTPAENTTLLNEAAARLRAAGYTPCVYCSASWAQSSIDMDALTCPVWLAYYYADPNDPDFDGCFSIEEVHTKWGAYMASLGDKLCGWQFGRIGYGGKYGVGSTNVDRDWIYFQPDEEKEEKPMYTSDTLKIGPVSGGDRATIRTLAENLAVAAVDDGDFIIVGPMSAGDRAAVSNKALALGLGCEDYTTPDEEPEGDEGAEQPPVEQPEDKPMAPAVDLTGVLEALERIEAAQAAQGQQLTALSAGVAKLENKLAAAGGALAG